MDIEKLIETLRQRGVAYVRAYGRYCSICDEIISALSALQAENEKLRKKIKDARLEGYVKGLGEMSEENETLLAELEQVKRCIEIVEHQRDAAIYDMTALMAGQCCDLCAVEYCNDRGKTEMCTAFKWRGPEKED